MKKFRINLDIDSADGSIVIEAETAEMAEHYFNGMSEGEILDQSGLVLGLEIDEVTEEA